MLWEEKDIQKLRTLFLQGLPIKSMARIMDKSPGAVNKALTRLHIRPKKQAKPLWHASDSHKKSLNKPQKAAIDILTLRETPSWQKLCQATKRVSNQYWVGWSEVIDYLQQCGEHVTVVKEGNKALFYLGKRIVSRAQLLVQANRNRSEQRLPPYCVESLTE